MHILISAVKDHTLQDVQTGNASRGDYFHQSNEDETVEGSNLNGSGNVHVSAQGNVNLSGSQITSQNGSLFLGANQGVTVQEVHEKHEALTETRSVDEGFL